MLCIREIYCTSTLPESKHLKSLKHERGMLPADLIRGVSGGVGDRITWLSSSRGTAAPPPAPGASMFGDGAFSAVAKVKRGGEGRVWLPGSLTGALVGSRRAGEADAESRAHAGARRAEPTRGHGEQSPRGDPSVGALATVPTSPCGRVCPASTSFCTAIKQVICQNLTSCGGTNIWAHPTPGRETAGTLCNERCPEALSHKSDFLPPGSCTLSHEHLATAFQAS